MDFDAHVKARMEKGRVEKIRYAVHIGTSVVVNSMNGLGDEMLGASQVARYKGLGSPGQPRSIFPNNAPCVEAVPDCRRTVEPGHESKPALNGGGSLPSQVQRLVVHV